MKKIYSGFVILLIFFLIFIEIFNILNNVRFVTQKDKELLNLKEKIVLFANIDNRF